MNAAQLCACNCQKAYQISYITSSYQIFSNDVYSTYKVCSKIDRTFAINTLFYNILSTVPFKVVLSTGDTPFLTFLPLLECFLERTFCDGAQFSYSIFLNIRVFKKRPNFLNSAPTTTQCALRLLSAPSGRFWQQTVICLVSLWALVVELLPLNWARAQAVRRLIRRTLCRPAWHLPSFIKFTAFYCFLCKLSPFDIQNCRTTHFKTSWADYVDTLIKSPALSLQIRRMATVPELPCERFRLCPTNYSAWLCMPHWSGCSFAANIILIYLHKRGATKLIL